MFLKGRRASLHVFMRLAVCSVAMWWPLAALAAADDDVPSPSNYGGAGLIDMHSARFFPDGYLALSTSITAPDDRYALTVQALPWAEFTFRYSITHAIFDSGIPVHDRSFDVKFRLARETEYVPEIALGLQDFLGTGIYSAEYFAGSKRWGAFDFTLGLGWGRLASRGIFENPFALLNHSLRTRSLSGSTGGLPLVKSIFRGPDMGLFGGVEYRTPIENLSLKIEYSSDAYVREKLESGNDYSFPLNVGLNYRPFQWLDIGLSLMHGHYAGLRVSALIDSATENWQARLDPPPRFRARPEEPANTILQHDTKAAPPGDASSPESRFVDLTQQREENNTAQEGAAAPALMLPALPPVVIPNLPAPVQPALPPGTLLDAATSERIKLGVENQKLTFLGAGVEGDKITVLIENPRYRRDTEAIARTARILSTTAPIRIESFEITLMRAGQPLTTVTLPRTELDQLANHESSPAEVFQVSDLSPGAFAPLDHLRPDLFPQAGVFLYPVFRQSLFAPENPVYMRFGVGGSADLRVMRGWFFDATVVASLWDNFNEIKRGTNSVLPHVRSDIAQYLKKGKVGLENFSTSYFFKLAPEIFGRASVGYLEQMFAGVGGELLYRPFGQRWAVGVDLWEVRQRDYHVLFELRPYQTFTGHLSAYYQLPWYDAQLAVSAGQYLAGDRGVTFALAPVLDGRSDRRVVHPDKRLRRSVRRRQLRQRDQNRHPVRMGSALRDPGQL